MNIKAAPWDSNNTMKKGQLVLSQRGYSASKTMI